MFAPIICKNSRRQTRPVFTIYPRRILEMKKLIRDGLHPNRLVKYFETLTDKQIIPQRFQLLSPNLTDLSQINLIKIGLL